MGEDGGPLFVAKDICDALGLTNSRKTLDRLDDDEKGVTTSYTLGGNQQVQVVNESGLYHLTITSRKDFAKRFRKWLTGDVAPSIRKHGVYVTDEALEKVMSAPTRQGVHPDKRVSANNPREPHYYTQPNGAMKQISEAVKGSCGDDLVGGYITPYPTFFIIASENRIRHTISFIQPMMKGRSMTEEQSSSYIYEIAIGELVSYDNQPRKHFDNETIESLKENILRNGIVTPLLVTKEHKIISGERRFRAAKQAGLDTVPVIYKEDNIYEVAVLDNIMREDLTVIERAEALKNLYDEQKKEEGGLTEEEFGNRFGFKKSSISEYFKIDGMKEKIKKLLRDEPAAALRKIKEIAAIKDAQKQLKAAKKYKESLKGKERQRSTKQAAAVKKVDSFLKDIRKIREGRTAFSTWDTSEQQAYLTKLKELEDQLSEIIDELNQSAN